jgi:hypothetical protein
MALILKKKSLSVLTNYGCDPHGIATCKALGLATQEGDDFFTIWHGSKGYKLVMNWLASPAQVQAELNSFMLFVLTEIENEKKAGGIPANVKPSDPVQMSAPEPSNDVIPLRDACAMYQRVKGTSSGSVYVAVALTDKLKIAVRVEGVQLSVRAEGAALDDALTVAKLTDQGLSLKAKPDFKYMSGHYPCTVEAPANKVLGAILLGCGIEFDTPLPKFNKVKGLCS